MKQVLQDVPDLKYVGDDCLRKKTHHVTMAEGMDIGKKLGEMLLAYRNITGWGRGLAAPQIGMNTSVFVTFVADKLETYINPEIIQRSQEKNLYRELCISSGLMWGDVERPQSITLRWLDVEGNQHVETFDGVMARLLQHESDHLEGIMNLDIALRGTVEFALRNPLEEVLRNVEE